MQLVVNDLEPWWKTRETVGVEFDDVQALATFCFKLEVLFSVAAFDLFLFGEGAREFGLLLNFPPGDLKHTDVECEPVVLHFLQNNLLLLGQSFRCLLLPQR